MANDIGYRGGALIEGDWWGPNFPKPVAAKVPVITVYWTHYNPKASSGSKAQMKPKFKQFINREKADEFFAKINELYLEKKTYQQGIVRSPVIVY